MNNTPPRSSVRLSPVNRTPRLRGRQLKKPPSPIDWVEQSYIELIQDVSLITMNYYEKKINQHAQHNNTKPDNSEDDENLPQHDNETLSLLQSLHDDLRSLRISSSEDETNEEDNDGDDDDDDDDDDGDYYTETIASSVCDIRNNLYQFYRDQIRLASDIDQNADLKEEEPITQIPRHYTPSVITESTGYISPDDVSIITTDIGSNSTIQEIHKKQNKYPKQYFPPQKKKKILSKMIERMKLAAEKPFWSLDSRF